MKPWKRLLYYLVLNILVSACTMLAVLAGWNHFHLADNRLPAVLPTAAPLVQRLPPTALPTPRPTQAITTYLVQNGDSLGSIALQFGVTVEDLMTLNALSQPDDIGVGQVLFVPVMELPPTAMPTLELPVATAGPTNAPEAGEIEIVSVLSPGNLEDESFIVRRVSGTTELSLENWRLYDQDGHEYTFPHLILFNGGAVTVFTKAGVNSVVELYWGLEQAVFQSGETITLQDATGNVQATFQVP